MNFLTVIFVDLAIVVGLFGEKEGAKVCIFLLALIGGLNYVFFGKLTLWNKDE
jgi:hypothetical protein